MLEPDSNAADTIAEKCTKTGVFNIRDLTRTTDQVLTTKTRQNAQNSLFSAPKIGCFCVAGLLSKRRI
ncbi:hypothetical protein RNO21_23130 [Escherichia coli]|nr:hypothetical protein [Escherichia coli]